MRFLRRILIATALAGAAVTTTAGATPAAAQDDAPAPVPSDPTGRWSLIEVPPGCPNPGLPDVVFVGTLTASDARIGRFQVDQVRAGSIDQFALGGLVDVPFGTVDQPDNPQRFLSQGHQYMIGASFEPEWSSLRSQLRAPQPLFGGDQVIAASEADTSCPLVDDPLQVLELDGSSIDTSVLSPLTTSKPRLLRALVVPLAVGLAILFGLAGIRWLFTGVGNQVMSTTNRPAPAAAPGSPAPTSDRRRAAGPAPRQPSRSSGRRRTPPAATSSRSARPPKRPQR